MAREETLVLPIALLMHWEAELPLRQGVLPRVLLGLAHKILLDLADLEAVLTVVRVRRAAMWACRFHRWPRRPTNPVRVVAASAKIPTVVPVAI